MASSGSGRFAEQTHNPKRMFNPLNCHPQMPEIIDGETGSVIGPPRRINLKTLRGVRRELARLYRQIDEGKITSQDGTRRAYVLRTIHDVIVSGEIERRLEDLEQRAPLGSRAMDAEAARLN